MHASGFDFVEVSLDYPWSLSLGEREMTALKRSKAELGLEIALHAPWRDLPLATVYPAVRESVLRVFERVRAHAIELDPIYINFHIHSFEAVEQRDSYDSLMAAASDSLAKIRKLLEEFELTVENLPRGFSSRIEDLEGLLACVDVSLCFDVAHAVISGIGRLCDINEPLDCLEPWINVFRDRVLVVHVHDIALSHGCLVEHTVVGRGILAPEGAKRLCSVLGSLRAKYLVLEVFKDEKGRRVRLGIDKLVDDAVTCKYLNVGRQR